MSSLLENHSSFTYISSEGLQGQRQSKCQIFKLFSSSYALIFLFQSCPKPAQDEKPEGFQRWIRAKLIFVRVSRPQLFPTSSILIIKMKILPQRVLSFCIFTYTQLPSQAWAALSWSIQLAQERPLWPTFLEQFLLQISRFKANKGTFQDTELRN